MVWLVGLILLCAIPVAPAHAAQVLDLKTNFGAVCDGVTDDTTAIQNWLAALGPGVSGTAPPGTCIFSSPLLIVVSDVGIRGSGGYQTEFRYTGSNTTVDLLTIGNGTAQIRNLSISGLRITSATRMAGGTALHMRKLVRSLLSDIVIDGQDGNGNLFHGIWFDQVDVVWLSGFDLRAQQDCLRVNGAVGSGPKADLGVIQGKIGSCRTGIRIGGAFGGFYLDQADVIANGQNLVVDNSLADEANREIILGSTSVLDTAQTGSNVYINDVRSAGGTIALGGWIASAAQHGVDVVKWNNGAISLGGNQLFNNKGDGIRVEDATTHVAIGTSLHIRNNGGWGVNATVATNNITPGVDPISNTLGAYAPNTRMQDLNPSKGYKKYPGGLIQQWVEISVTGAANSFLGESSPTPATLAIAFPIGAIDGTATASITGFSNGPAVATASCTVAGTQQVNITLVSSVAVVNPQTLKCVLWGH